jgi:hypothetical protein
MRVESPCWIVSSCGYLLSLSLSLGVSPVYHAQAGRGMVGHGLCERTTSVILSMRQRDLSLERSSTVYLKAEWVWLLVVFLFRIQSTLVNWKDSGII